MQFQLVLRFRKTSLEGPDAAGVLEHALAESLGDAVRLDGHDTGPRDIDFFIATSDPASTFRRSKPALERLQLLDRVTVAYRLEGGARFTVVWPLGYGRRFALA